MDNINMMFVMIIMVLLGVVIGIYIVSQIENKLWWIKEDYIEKY